MHTHMHSDAPWDVEVSTIGIVVANTKAVVPQTAHAGGRLGLVGTTWAAVYVTYAP